ncbi:YkgJ family cysteine cluster protein [Undibacterium oligocarboniphilum]|uniref:YkgJ family cysteine cluster protein n=1 Tax=Undibacterium oligocarboniphilum TaxID=666702 RepID=A0A850QMV4_9BURK|nr:YkgJ family cysteine cluster protein [Undibacterium oligocarboniphilum]MBC3869803.1 YkgJ family cysteine cluster protein [Undibacterium oligocarboniphilum]NVO77406.1 YkgJ family cysteine cluster protein [Undibacterium oligocarboniphilum]
MTVDALSEQEQQSFLQAITLVRNTQGRRLTVASVTPQQMMQQLHQNIDQISQQKFDGRQVACAAGCSHCCRRQRVEITQAEAAFIAGQMTLHEPDLARQTYARLQQAAAAEQKETACPLLHDEKCSIYAWRPAVCRKAHSYDASACATASETLPQNLERLLRSEALMTGTRLALDDHGWPQTPLLLGEGLLMAFSQVWQIPDQAED